MSQSDYIELKKTQNLLYNLKSKTSTLTSRDYTRFKQYSIESSVVNTLPQLNQLIPLGKMIIFDMNINVNCPQMQRNLNNIDKKFSFIRCITST